MADSEEGRAYPKVRALHDYTARTPNELSFKKGDLITVYDFVDDTWWEGGLGDAEGFVPAAYVEHRPSWMMPPSEAQGQAEEAAAEAAAQAGGPGAPVSPKKAADRPDLAKALRAHAVRAKHEVRAVNPGLNEFKRQFTQIKKKAATPKPEEDELSKALRRARESTDHSARRQQEADNMPELHRRFSQRFPAGKDQ